MNLLRRITWITLLLFVIALLFILPAQWSSKDSCTTREYEIYVVDHGYHTSIVVPAETDQHNWNTLLLFKDASYYEFAWGDSAYYMTKEPQVGIGLNALFRNTPSVLHVVGVSNSPEAHFASKNIKKLKICKKDMAQLIAHFLDSFSRDQNGQIIYLKEGWQGKRSAFYSAGANYNLFFTCNDWVVRGLRKAGMTTPYWEAFPKLLCFIWMNDVSMFC